MSTHCPTCDKVRQGRCLRHDCENVRHFDRHGVERINVGRGHLISHEVIDKIDGEFMRVFAEAACRLSHAQAA